MDESLLLTPELSSAIAREINKQLYIYGFWGLLILIAVGVTIVFLAKKYFESIVEKEIRNFQSELDKKSAQNLEIWKMKKELTFDFIDFMENRIFQNAILSDNPTPEAEATEKKSLMREFNILYGKIYLLFDTDILSKMNNLINGTVSEIHRYYLYREIRKELQRHLSVPTVSDEDCPFIDRDVSKILTTPGKMEAKTIEELRHFYPFAEQGTQNTKVRGMPFFGDK